jgi:ABC-type bacteriocin/lantibiotic exporter with double-glycine peptidase domain
MKRSNSVLTSIWRSNRYAITLIYAMNILEETLQLLIPVSIGVLIDTFINDKGYGILAFTVTYIGKFIASGARRIFDTVLFTKIFNHLCFRVIDHCKENFVSTTKMNARIELMKQVVEFFERDIPFLVKSVITILGSCFLLYFYNAHLLLLSGIVIFPSMLINFIYSKKIRSVTTRINDQYEKQVDTIDFGSKKERILYFEKARSLYIKKSTLEAFNFSFLEVFVFIMIFVSVLIVCRTNNLTYGDIAASYAIILRFAYSFDFIPLTTTRLASLYDVLARINGAFQKEEHTN